MKMLSGELKAGEGIKPSNIKYIVPRSTAMSALVTKINTNQIFLVKFQATEPTKDAPLLVTNLQWLK